MSTASGFWGSQSPTPGQRRYIAILSAELKMPEPDVRSYGEAGRMIRELQAEKRHRALAKREENIRQRKQKQEELRSRRLGRLW